MRNQPWRLNDICYAVRKTSEHMHKDVMVKDSVMDDGSHNYVPIINAEYDEDFDAIVLTTSLSDKDRPPTIRYTGIDSDEEMETYQEELWRTRNCVLNAFYRLGALAGELHKEDITAGANEIQNIRDQLIKSLGFNPEAVKNTLKED